ncbi:MAG: threonylcarbamoyl-AMP synthase [Ruminococcus sp.]|nr:threonylcarbamoyl-AMP synthase [Ruminococcus sp.]
MNTLFLKNTTEDIKKAAAILTDGGLVAMPTETVYGLAADALNGEAVRRIFEAKGRPMDNPLIVHVAEFSDIERLHLVRSIPEKAVKLAQAFSPGPLTIIMEKGDVIPDEVSAGLDTVAIRIPSHPDAQRLLRSSGLALAAPSANTSGKPSPTTAQHVIDDMDGRIEAVLDGGACGVGVESTVITLATDIPRILRPGIITREEIEAVIGPIEVDKAVLNKLENNEKAASPGMKYKHYAPKARVILLRGSDEKYINYLNRLYARDKSIAALCYIEDVSKIHAPCITMGSETDEKQQAQALFDALRAVDELQGVKTVYAHCPSATGVGMALYNRLIRAAAFEVIDLPTKRVIGLTGQTGAGKSEVSRMLSEMGAVVISADEAAREAVEDSEVKAMLCAAFGDVLKADGSLDRRLVAQIAFSKPGRTAVLNAITHPKIASIMLSKAETADADTVFFDASQLFEARMEVYCDRVIGVIADEAIRMERLLMRDGISREDVALRMSAQFDEGFFLSFCNDILYNNGSLRELSEEVDKLYERSVNR